LINRLSQTFKEFIASQKFAGILLLVATAVSLALANGAYGNNYIHFWDEELALHFTPLSVINDLLMAFFFLLVGLEIKREFLVGELASRKKAMLPAAAALGGMLFPAIIYMFINKDTATFVGWGIPMATDIAFAIGIMSLLGDKVPNSLKVMLIALAVADDLGAILVIAIFYSKQIIYSYLIKAAIVTIFLIVLNKLKIKNIIAYLLFGSVLWYYIHLSGIHATIAGVLLAFTIPLTTTNDYSPLQVLEHILHKPVNYIVMPLFALANTCLLISFKDTPNIQLPILFGIGGGLLIGKPLGIYIFSKITVALGWAELPEGSTGLMIIGVGILGGIGFSMSIFMTNLAFPESESLRTLSKFYILVASLLAGLFGYIWLSFQKKTNQ
jgi:NhaA family Na+:H+ antiporter